MEISVTGKNMDVGESLTSHVQNNLVPAVTKYFSQALDASVNFSKAGRGLRADITVHPGPRGLAIQGGGESADAYGAFDDALERISKQLRRYKRRLNDHHKSRDHENISLAQQYVMEPESETEEVSVDGQPAIIAEMPTGIESLTVGQAVMRMDLADQPVIMFRNSASGSLNVVYRRPDGNVGWIDPAVNN